MGVAQWPEHLAHDRKILGPSHFVHPLWEWASPIIRSSYRSKKSRTYEVRYIGRPSVRVEQKNQVLC